MFLQQMREYSHGLGVLHPNDIHLGWQSRCALGTTNSNRSSVFPLWGWSMQIESTLEGYEVLVVPPHHPALFAHYTLPEKCP